MKHNDPNKLDDEDLVGNRNRDLGFGMARIQNALSSVTERFQGFEQFRAVLADS